MRAIDIHTHIRRLLYDLPYNQPGDLIAFLDPHQINLAAVAESRFCGAAAPVLANCAERFFQFKPAMGVKRIILGCISSLKLSLKRSFVCIPFLSNPASMWSESTSF